MTTTRPNTPQVTGIDPAPAKGLTIWDGSAAQPVRVPSAKATAWIKSEGSKRGNWLICWDSPLSFDSSINFSDRPIDKVVRAAVSGWVKEGKIDQKAVSIRPFSGCPHWALSCEALGLPFSKARQNPYKLAFTKEEAMSGGIWLLEVHPAVALALWWAELPSNSGPMPVYKGKPEKCQQIAKELGFDLLVGRDWLDDDVLDAFVACRVGQQFLTGESMWIGDPRRGGYILPSVAATKWSLQTEFSKSIERLGLA